MPILYGTTSDGESLPVQVNEFGQLVAQGLLGPPGPEGPIGPPNPDGELPLSSGVFTPVWQSSDEAGSCLYDYETQEGHWFRYGHLLFISARIVSRNDIVTNARGNLQIGGVPEGLIPLRPSQAYNVGLATIYQARFRGTTECKRPVVQLATEGTYFGFREYWNGINKNINFSVLDGTDNDNNSLTFSWMWFHADAGSTG